IQNEATMSAPRKITPSSVRVSSRGWSAMVPFAMRAAIVAAVAPRARGASVRCRTDSPARDAYRAGSGALPPPRVHPHRTSPELTPATVVDQGHHAPRPPRPVHLDRRRVGTFVRHGRLDAIRRFAKAIVDRKAGPVLGKAGRDVERGAVAVDAQAQAEQRLDH